MSLLQKSRDNTSLPLAEGDSSLVGMYTAGHDATSSGQRCSSS